MPVTITAVDTIQLRIPLDIWAPPPMFAGRAAHPCRGGLCAGRRPAAAWSAGASPSASAARWSIAAFDNWVRRLAVGQDPTDQELMPRIERMLHGLGRAGADDACASAASTSRCGTSAASSKASRCRSSSAAPSASASRPMRRCMQYAGNVEHVKRNTARALERGYRHIKLHERTAEAVAAAREVTGPDIPIMVDTNCAWTPARSRAAGRRHEGVQPVLGRGADLAAGGFRVARQTAQGHRRAAGDGRERHQPERFPQDDRRRRDRLRAAQRRQDRRHHRSCFADRDRGREGRRHLRAARVLLRPGLSRDAALHRLQGARRAARAACSPMSAFVPYAKTVPDVNGAVEVPDRPGLGADPEEDMIAKFRVSKARRSSDERSAGNCPDEPAYVRCWHARAISAAPRDSARAGLRAKLPAAPRQVDRALRAGRRHRRVLAADRAADGA